MLRTLTAALAVSLIAFTSVSAQTEVTGKQAQKNTLEVGDKAPKLEVRDWLKGDAIKSFKKGHTYVIDCWATWCGPCIRAIPHMTKTQKQFKEKDVHVIGVAIWERNWDGVKPFVDQKGDEMAYAIARDTEEGKIADTWMKAAGRNGIPSVFIVNGEGKLAWMGHPMEMDGPLEKIVKGEWDLDSAKREGQLAKEKAEKAQRDAQKINALMESYQKHMVEGNFEKAYKVAASIVDGVGKDNAGLLNFVAWSIVDPEADHEVLDLELARRAAAKADELTKHEDAAIIDTLARCHFRLGEVDKAIKLQEAAVKKADDEMKSDLQKALEEYRKAKQGGKEF